MWRLQFAFQNMPKLSITRYGKNQLEISTTTNFRHLYNRLLCFHKKQNGETFTSHQISEYIHCPLVSKPPIVPAYDDHCGWRSRNAASIVEIIG